MEEIPSIEAYIRAANYLTATQIFLWDNQLLQRPLSFADIKPRLLGHWGTGPGINFVYAHLNRLIRKQQAEIMFVLGPGHGFPALQANLFLEGTLGEYYPSATRDLAGIEYLTKNFSWPGGFPSHSNPGTPGVILEGGELGYSLATAYGSVLDNPTLITACLIGDGEAETGPLSAAWQLVKYVDPGTNGAVLPILHLNGYKISQETTFGRMSDHDITSFFRGAGYEPYIVDEGHGNVHETMVSTLDSVYESIRSIQEHARKNPTSGPWRMPMIVLRTPKGWTGIKTLHGKPIEGTWRAHQVVATEAKTDPEELEAVETWFRSYKFEELFSEDHGFSESVMDSIPSDDLRMGKNKRTFGGDKVVVPLELPDVNDFAEDASVPGTVGSSSMKRAGAFLESVFRLNHDQKNFRFFSPDETYSNKLDEIFKATARAYTAEHLEGDIDLAPTGRSLELLSEHTLQGALQGYVLTGRHGVFASYEAFIQVVASMVDQYAKFIKVSRTIPWRGDVPSLNYILTSSGWRQEHNGFSHQNPAFIDDMLRRHGRAVRVYLPPDANSTLVVLKTCLESRSGINVLAAGKTLEPRWLTPELAEKELETGLMTWDFASDENPDLVFIGAGDYMTKEALAALKLVKTDLPNVRLRFVNIMELSCLSTRDDSDATTVDLNQYVTTDKPIIANFHGYPETLEQLFFNCGIDPKRVSVHGYIEQGSTTTPFDMQVRNRTSRYQLAIEAVQRLANDGVVSSDDSARVVKQYQDVLDKHATFIQQEGVDLPEVEEWTWN